MGTAFDGGSTQIESITGGSTALREEIAKVVPGYEAIATIDRTKAEFQIPGRTMHGKEFATKACFY